MRVRVVQSLFFCAIASFVALSLGILVSRGGAQQKLGPSGDEQGVAHARTVRVILPDTLDGQSVPGRGSGLPDRRRDLSPVYPISSAPHEDKSKSMVAAGTTPSPRARDSDNTSPVTASVLAHDLGQTGPQDEDGFRDPSSDVDLSTASDTRFFRHVPASRHARGSYYRHFYAVSRRARPLYPYGALARLSASDHGR